MRTVIVGGGKGCRAIIELALGPFLKELKLDIVCVVDINPEARGIKYAREKGLATSLDMHETLSTIENIELVIELTGSEAVLKEINKILPPGVRLMDHTFARLLWDLVYAQEDQKRQLQDMTALEQKIEKEWHFLQSLFDTIPDPVIVLDKNKKAIKTNASFQKFSGYSQEDSVGKTCEELLAKTELAEKCIETTSLMDDIIDTGKPQTLIWKTSPPDETYWEVTRTPIADQEGRIEAILCIWHRITEKVKLRREIESAEQRFKAFIDSANDWISIKDLEGRYVIVNPVIAKAFHRQPEDFIGKTPEQMFDRELARTIRMHDRQVIQTGHHHTYDEIVLIDGREHKFQTVRFPLTDYKGEIIGSCTIMRDITSEHELRDQLMQAVKLAAVGKLAAGVAHEINNPLTGILAYAEDMFEELDKNDSHRGDIEVIIRETLRCRDIVRNLLDFARQEAPKLKDVSPNQVVEQALSLLAKLPQFRNINIIKELDDGVPYIQGDPQQLQQVILNLMLNAAEAMEMKGKIGITTEYDLRHDKCLIMVRDDGPGIPENLIDKIFEPFFSTKGTNGLGLAVSWGIIERHQGTIEVDMTRGGGAIFRIILPALYRKKNKKKSV
jgi:PAS domain S-box-containing protein